MNKKIVIAIDAMGGENAPNKNIEGIALFIKNNQNKNDFFFNIFGDKEQILKAAKRYNFSENLFEVLHSSTIVSDDETPLTAIKNSKDSSMWNAINSQITINSDISLSAGNTGVLFVISRMLLKTIETVSRPALAGLWPNKKNMNVVLDLGANVECDDVNLVDFAEMGSALYKSLFPDDVAKVALLNIGSEEIKGTESLKKAYMKLKDINAYGDFEFNGFTGNIALKTAEGTAKFITDSLKESLTETILSKISIIFSYFALKKFKSKLDPRKFNGAIFLGLKGPVVKSHGSTDAVGFYHYIDLCYRIIKGDLMNKIKSNLSHASDKR